MLTVGDTVRYCDKEVVVLTCSENEVLVFWGKNYVQWIDRALIELIKPAG